MLATCLHMMQGTPYIYQGEELGMTNAPFEDVSDFRDLDSINAYRELVEEFGDAEILISNYKEVNVKGEMMVRPYEAFVIRKQLFKCL